MTELLAAPTTTVSPRLYGRTNQSQANWVIPRLALIDQLDRGAAGPLTLVAAPAGSGKTVLVRSWLERRPHHLQGWVTVERGERDAQHFWARVVAQVRAAAPESVTIEPLVPIPEFNGHALVERLVSELSLLEQRLILVIDDLHELAEREILHQLRSFLDHVPATVHVVLLTRRDPVLGLHRFRLAGELTEIRSTDLRFTLHETRQVLAASGIVLSEESLKLLHDRTEGWAAGLRLAVISLAATTDREGFVVEFSGSERTVAEYLLAEVLDTLAADVRRLLVRTSLLERVNGPLADLLTGDSGSDRHLQAMAGVGGFVVPLDASRTWFRFHHLIADLLRVQLRHTEPDEIPRLHRLAAHWHADHGNAIEAITHAQAAGDRDFAAGLLIEHYFSLLFDGRQATAHALFEALAHDLDAAPEIALVAATDQLVDGSLEQASAYLAVAKRNAGIVPPPRRHRFDMVLLVTRLSLARRLGDFRSVVEELQPASALLAETQSTQDISIHNDVRALMLMNLGIVEVWSGRFDEGARHLEEAGELAERIGRAYLRVNCEAHRAQAVSWGSFVRGLEAASEAIALAERHGWGADPAIYPALVTQATSLMQMGRLDEAQAWLERAERTLDTALVPAVGLLLHMSHGAVHFARGQYAEAIGCYRTAERLGVRLVSGSPLAMQLRCVLLRSMLRLGMTEAVRAELHQMSEAERMRGEVREVLAELSLAEGDGLKAVEVLAPTLSGAADVHHPVVLVRSWLLEALARHMLGQTAAAEEALERALDLASQDALVLPFLFVPCRELLERHPRHRTAHGAFLADLLDAQPSGSVAQHGALTAVALEELSDAELRVLRFLPTNLTAADIASEIYASVNTVKTHMRHIYAKLDAHSRAEVVARARELRLLGGATRRE